MDKNYIRQRAKEKILRVLLLIIIIAIALFFSRLVTESSFLQELVRDYGYAGILIASFFSGFNIVFPIPVIVFLPIFLAAGLNFWIIVILITIGVTIADSIAFLIGKTGRELIDLQLNQTIVHKLEKVRDKYFWGPIIILTFYAAIAPIPNEIILIPIGFLGYKFKHIFPAILLGNSIFNTLIILGYSSFIS